MSNWKTRAKRAESCLVTRQFTNGGRPRAGHEPPEWKPHLVGLGRNSGKLAGKPQVNQDQLEIFAGNLQG